ncbi:MAG: helix-turn-helix transcriptional regulator [Acidimicrobiales bacterium]
MNRLERLLNLVAALLDARQPLTRAEIQQRVPGYGTGPSARRAFERDKDALRAMGIPLVTEPLEADVGDGYRIPPDQYRLADPGLVPDELAALHLAVSAVRVGGGGTTGRSTGPEAAGVAIWKLGGATGGNGGNGVAGPVAALPGSEHLPALFAAVSERRTVRFGYKGSARTVDPHRLSFASGHWYLIGRDHGRDDVRNFRLDRIDGPLVAGGAASFEQPARAGPPVPAPPPWRMGDEEEVEATVLVDAEQADWAVAKAGADALRQRRPDGGAVLALPVTNRDAFRSFVLGFLHHAEVLGPPELRAEMVAWLQGLAGPGEGAA